MTPRWLRNFFPYLAIGILLAGLGYAISFGRLEPADFTYNNGAEIKTVDPALATGSPEGRIINALFEGLLRNMPTGTEPDETNSIPLRPVTMGMADTFEISEDGKTYTFHIRETATWSNGDSVTAEDFRWSWQRMLHPETGSEYVYQLYSIEGAVQYNTGVLELGGIVEVEHGQRRTKTELFPRASISRGELIAHGIWSAADGVVWADASASESTDGDHGHGGSEEESETPIEVYKVAVYASDHQLDTLDLSGDSDEMLFIKHADDQQIPESVSSKYTRCFHVLPDFHTTVGLKVSGNDQRTLSVTLVEPTPYFSDLVAFYPLYPVHRETVESHGAMGWTKQENIVTNGPFLLNDRRIRDRIRLVKNPGYWNADSVSLEIIDALSVESDTTALNMYMNGQVDWLTSLPTMIMKDLMPRDDFVSAPMLASYFYRLNVDQKPLDDIRVRRALNMSLDKAKITERVSKAGEIPARSYVPPGLTGYDGYQCGEFNGKEAKRLLAEAGYPGGEGFPSMRILYNTNDNHQAIAQVIQQDWKNNLGIEVRLENMEWRTFLSNVSETQFDIARAGWIGDYPDPNTFLDMFVTDGPNNQTNWSSQRYDELIESAKTLRGNERLKALSEAEKILMEEQPIIPIYYYVSKNMVSGRVKGFSANIQDVHPLHVLTVEDK